MKYLNYISYRLIDRLAREKCTHYWNTQLSETATILYMTITVFTLNTFVLHSRSTHCYSHFVRTITYQYFEDFIRVRVDLDGEPCLWPKWRKLKIRFYVSIYPSERIDQKSISKSWTRHVDHDIADITLNDFESTRRP